jgi:prevent-host-death family protein
LSSYLRQVKAGTTVIITERGKPVGRIVPLEPTPEAQLRELVQVGMMAWSGRKLAASPALSLLPRVRGRRTVADLLLEDRE